MPPSPSGWAGPIERLRQFGMAGGVLGGAPPIPLLTVTDWTRGPAVLEAGTHGAGVGSHACLPVRLFTQLLDFRDRCECPCDMFCTSRHTGL